MAAPTILLASLAFVDSCSKSDSCELLELVYFTSFDSYLVHTFLPLLSLFVLAIIAIRVHRAVLLGLDHVAWNLTPKRLGRFLSATLIVGFGSASIPLLVLLLNLPQIPALVVAFIAMYYIFVRTSLVFPSIAVDRPLTITGAWGLSGPHQFSLAMGLLVVPLLIGLPLYLIPDNPFLSPVVAILVVAIEIFSIAILSYAYQEVLRLGS